MEAASTECGNVQGASSATRLQQYTAVETGGVQFVWHPLFPRFHDGNRPSQGFADMISW
jgi:hypothetical protein